MADRGSVAPRWDGATLRIDWSDDPLKRLADLAHDLGHLQCPRPDRRGLIEFGLGLYRSRKSASNRAQ